MFSLQALELQPGDRGCLVARSRCYLQLGDPDKALNDAEESLVEDKEFHKVCVIQTLTSQILAIMD